MSQGLRPIFPFIRAQAFSVSSGGRVTAIAESAASTHSFAPSVCRTSSAERLSRKPMAFSRICRFTLALDLPFAFFNFIRAAYRELRSSFPFSTRSPP